jgi:hypothetical protein
MSAIVTSRSAGIGLDRPGARPFRPGRIRERAIDAACLLVSLAGAGALALTLMAAAELPSVGAAPLKMNVAAPAGHG